MSVYLRTRVDWTYCAGCTAACHSRSPGKRQTCKDGTRSICVPSCSNSECQNLICAGRHGAREAAAAAAARSSSGSSFRITPLDPPWGRRRCSEAHLLALARRVWMNCWEALAQGGGATAPLFSPAPGTHPLWVFCEHLQGHTGPLVSLGHTRGAPEAGGKV